MLTRLCSFRHTHTHF